MLDAEQCRVVAKVIEGEVICAECAAKHYGKGWEHGDVSGEGAMIEYEASSEFPDGLWCGECQAEIVSPTMCDCDEPRPSDNRHDHHHCGNCGGLLRERDETEE